jgi:hypothetical protein
LGDFSTLLEAVKEIDAMVKRGGRL